MTTKYTQRSGLEWSTIDFNRHTNDTFVLLIDGTTLGVTRLRDYGAGPARYLWNAYLVDELPGGGWVIVETYGTFRHAARQPNGSLADAIYALHDARQQEYGDEMNAEAEAEWVSEHGRID